MAMPLSMSTPFAWLISDEGDFPGSAYHFQPPGSGGTGTEGSRLMFEDLIGQIPAVLVLKFHPTHEEVINFYLLNKNARNLLQIDPIRTDHGQDIISHHPGTLQAYYPLLSAEDAWWFYMTRNSKYPNNSKQEIERAGGYWKVSKKSDPIGDIGFKRVLNFREGCVKGSSKPTNWYMEEYSTKQFAPNKEDGNWIIVKIYQQLTVAMPMSMSTPCAWLMSDEGNFPGSAYHFQPPGSGGTGNEETEEQNPLQDDQYQDLPAEKEDFINFIEYLLS